MPHICNQSKCFKTIIHLRNYTKTFHLLTQSLSYAVHITRVSSIRKKKIWLNSFNKDSTSFTIEQLHDHNRARFDKSVDILQQTCYQQADIRMRSHGLRELVDDKSVASGQQTRCKLIVKTCYPQACCKLFQQVATSLILTDLSQLDEIDKFLETCWQVVTRR